MKPKSPVFAFLPAFVLLGISSVQAQWSGLGVGASTGNDIATPGNWSGGIINGNFSTINTVGTHNLVLSGNISVASLNFDNAASSNTVALTSGANGSDYTSGGTTVTFSPPSGATGTTATATETVGTGGAITGITINSHGSEYYGPTLPDLILNGDGTGAIKGLSGILPTGATHIVINSNTAGVQRTISVGGNITVQDRSDSTLTFGADTVLNLTANSAFVINGGGILNDSTNVFVDGNITSAGNFTLGKSTTGTVTYNGDVTLNATYTNTAGTSTFNGVYSGIGGVTVSTAGTINLNNALNSFTGTAAAGSGTTINTVSFANAGQVSGLGSGTAITLNGSINLSAAGTGTNVTNRTITTSNNGSGNLRNNATGTSALHFLGGTYTASGNGTLGFGGSNSSSVNIFGYNISSTGTRNVSVGGTTGDTAVWRLTGNNAFSGSLTVSRGALEFSSTASLGTGTALTLSNLGSAGFRHVGLSDTVVSRNITYGGTSTSNYSTTITNNGAGTLSFIGQMTAANGNSVKTLTLSGFNTGDNIISSSILRGTDGTSATTGLVKSGAGTWILSGANAIGGGVSGTAGTVAVNNGRLVLDYATNDVMALASNITLGGGTLEIRGKSGAELTSETLGTLATSTDSGFSRIVVDNNGGAGTTLNLGEFTRNNGTAVLFDLSSGGKVTTTEELSNGLLSSGAPHWFVRTDNTATGVDYVSKNGADEIVALGATTALPASGGNTSTNYALNGSFSLTGATSVGTVRVVTTDGGALDIGSNTLTTGSGSLFVGSGNYSLNGTTGYIGTSTGTAVLNYFGTGTLNLNANIGASNGTVFLVNGGGGLINWTSASNTTGGHQFMGGVIRGASNSFNHTNATTGAGSGEVRIATGAILELQDDFTRDIGGGAGHVEFKGNGGFSAFGGDRTVTLENGDDLNWGQTDFVTDTFLLGSNFSDSKLTFTNNLNLGTLSRVVEVAAGTNSNIDARLSGVISSTGGGLVKRGTGKLEITNANTYSGETWVQGGELIVNNTSGSGTGSGEVRLSASTTLSGHGTISGTVSGSGTIAPGGSPGVLTVGQINASQGLSFLFEMTALNPTYGVPAASGNDVLRITSVTPFSTALTAGNVITVDFSEMSLNVGDIIYGGFYATTDFSASIAGATVNYIGLDGLTANMSVTQQSADFGSGLVNGYVTRFEIIPEPSSALLAGLGISGLLVRRRRA